MYVCTVLRIICVKTLTCVVFQILNQAGSSQLVAVFTAYLTCQRKKNW